MQEDCSGHYNSLDDLRERFSHLRERVSVLEIEVQRTATEVEANSQKLDTLINKISSYEGKLGGVLLAAVAIFTVFKVLVSNGWEFLQRLLGG